MLNLKIPLVAAVLLASAAIPKPAAAEPAPDAQGETCGKVLSDAVRSAWSAIDGRDGRLGCPLESESATATSFRGTTARAAPFQGGEIVLHMSGPLVGNAFAVAACDRLYVQYGGVSGWLGLPTSNAINTPDGQRQRFEGGFLMLTRATGTCEAERS